MGNNILLAGEDEFLLSRIKMQLDRLGKEVDITLDGHSALEIIKSRKKPSSRISLLITDSILPEMSGIELIKKVRKLRQQIPVLLILDNLDHGMEKELAGLDVNGVIFKPVISQSFINKVNSILAS